MFLSEKAVAGAETFEKTECYSPKKHRNQPATNSSSQRLLAQVPQSSQKLSTYIQDLNERGLKAIRNGQLAQAQRYFLQCERLLEMGASLGKSIDRELILTVLGNEAFVHQKLGKLESAKRYLEAVIFNLTEFIEKPAQAALVKELVSLAERGKPMDQLRYFIETRESSLRGLFNRIYQLGVAELEYAQLLAEGGQHEAAAAKAKKSVKTMITLCKNCRIYHSFKGQRQNEDEINLLQFIIKFQQDFGSESYIYLKKQINAFLKNQRNRNEPFDIQLFNKLKAQDFLLLKPKKYRDNKNEDNSFHYIQQIEEITSNTNHIRKALTIACAHFIMGAQMMQKVGETQQQNKGKLFVLGSQLIFQKQKEQKVREAELHYLYSICLTLNYLHESANFPSQILQTYKLVEQQQPKSSILVSDVKTEDIQNQFHALTCKYTQFMSHQSKSINKMCIISGIQCDIDKQQAKQSNLIMPPSNDQFLFELPSTDSISINSNSSMIDVLKSAENAAQSTRTDLDAQVYFSKPKLKQSSKNNPLFSGTLNLLNFQKEINLSTSIRHNKAKIQIQKQQTKNFFADYKKPSISRKKVQTLEKHTANSQSAKKTTNNNLKKVLSVGKLRQPTLMQNHQVYINKTKVKYTKGKNNNIGHSTKTKGIFQENIKNTIYTTKQNTSFHIKFNKVKSPSSKNPSGRFQLTHDSKKIVKKLLKSNSKQHSLSKSKSVSKKNSVNKNLKLRFQPVYFNKK